MSLVLNPVQLGESLAGGVLIGASAAGLLLVNGRIAGISGILAGGTTRGGQPWQWAFLAGLLLAGALSSGAVPLELASPNWVLLGVAGLLVGFGTRLSGGCTSGHGICGLSRLSPRSLVAVLVFMGVAGVTVFVQRHVL
jgi:uncharacterized membrane protein YedE/YeeE